MEIGLTDDQAALRDELRAYFAELMTAEVVEEMVGGEMGGPASRAACHKMGDDGWLGLGWPEEFGGQGRSPIEQHIFYDEALAAGAPIPMLSINSVAPTIMKFGTQEQMDFYLPRILRGDAHFAIGYTEPSSGTDLASLTTKAVRDGDEWVINGQKIFTSLADQADYVWLACRTDPDAPKHRGISIIIVPTDVEGFSLSPIRVMGGARTNMTFYDNVRVPFGNLVGELHGGWNLIVNQLNHERIAIGPPGWVWRQLRETIKWASDTHLPDGRRVIDQEWVQVNLARVRAKAEFLQLVNWKVAWSATEGRLDVADASSTKVFATEFYIEAYRLLMEIIGPASALKRGSPGAALAAGLERAYQGTLFLTFGGGTNEIQRDLVSVFGLGMPRSIR